MSRATFSDFNHLCQYIYSFEHLCQYTLIFFSFLERVDKFTVRSNITSNKLQDFETVSRGSRHRSNHTQKYIPSVVAGHQFLQFRYISPDNGLFPITM